MKKLISLCLIMVLCLTLCPFAYADSFTLRNGIQFGDTIDDVKQKEKDLTLEKEDESSDSFTLKYTGEIAGMDGTATFYFDKDEKKLTDLKYSIETDNLSEMFDIQRKIKDSCIRQYGDPVVLDEDETTFPIKGKAIDYAAYAVYMNRQLGEKSYIWDYDEWVVFGEDGNNTKIESVSYYDTSNFLGTEYTHCYVDVSYSFFTQDELDAIIKAAAQKEMEEAAAAQKEMEEAAAAAQKEIEDADLAF